MHVLLLGPEDSPLGPWLRARGETVTATSSLVGPEASADFLVSYGYRYILRRPVLDRFGDRAINLHVSLLPWNRGADPNLWSFVDDTPKGVTIHHLDEGVDTGDIIAQREVLMGSDETLRTSYQKLQVALQQLFQEQWPLIREGRAPRHPQRGPGSRHLLRDKEALLAALPAGWDTPVSLLRPRSTGG
jgi:methionyl-tRNA formyltransferase